VDKIKSGQWLAYRDDHELLIDGGEIAMFATREEAQRATDATFATVIRTPRRSTMAFRGLPTNGGLTEGRPPNDININTR
jgi:hypothetical protein